jgi:hypothetical protein
MNVLSILLPSPPHQQLKPLPISHHPLATHIHSRNRIHPNHLVRRPILNHLLMILHTVVVKESELEVILHNLATVKRMGRIGIIPIFDSCMTASLTLVRHKYACVTSEFARLFAEQTCSVVRYYLDTDQSA